MKTNERSGKTGVKIENGWWWLRYTEPALFLFPWPNQHWHTKDIWLYEFGSLNQLYLFTLVETGLRQASCWSLKGNSYTLILIMYWHILNIGNNEIIHLKMKRTSPFTLSHEVLNLKFYILHEEAIENMMCYLFIIYLCYYAYF